MERNYNTYLSGMAKSEVEKLFFLDHLCLDDYDIIIDFGCGAGKILKTCAENSVARCYGVDKDPYMRNVASENCKYTKVIFVESLKDIPIKDSDYILIIFSSVLHEVEDGWWDIHNYLRQFKGRLTIAVRDMYFDLTERNTRIDYNNFAKIIRHSNHNILADFVAKYGMRYLVDMYHYLLKYSYVDNWELELKENYFSFGWEYLTAYAKEIVYDRAYTLEAKKKKVLQHFGIDMTLPTHRQLIVKW